MLQNLNNFVSIELHQLTGVDGHFLENNSHLFRRQRTSLLKLKSQRSKDIRIHTTKSHLIVVLDGRLNLFISGLISEDSQQTSLSPTNIGGKFNLKSGESIFFVHGSIISDPQKKVPLKRIFFNLVVQ